MNFDTLSVVSMIDLKCCSIWQKTGESLDDLIFNLTMIYNFLSMVLPSARLSVEAHFSFIPSSFPVSP